MNYVVLLTFCTFFIGCTSKQPVSHLHNYPIIKGQDCPGIITRHGYDDSTVKLRASAVNMRPVDYLHWVNNKRWKAKEDTKNVGFANDNR